MAEELLSKYVDRASFEADTKFGIEELAKLEAAYIRLRDLRVNLQAATGLKDISTNATAATTSITGLTTAIAAQTTTVGKAAQANTQQNASLQQNIKTLNDYKAALAANVALQKQAVKDVEAGKINADEYRLKITQLTEAQFKYKQAISDVTKEIKSQTQLKFAAPTSVLEARTQNAQLTRQRDNTATTDPAKIAELNALIDRNNQLIDLNSDKLAKQKINIGNYGPSVKAALSVLEEEIIKINAQLSVTDKNSKAFDALTKQANLLKTVASGLDKEFGSTRQELRALEEATKKVGTEFGITSVQFRKLAEEVGQRKDELKDIQSAVNFESSDTKNLDAIVGAVQAVTGAYGAYEAATVLLGDDNEELAKSMQKLQAVLTLVTSVQAVANALQSESATIQGLLSAKAAFLAAAQKLVAFTSGEASVALTSEVVAAQAAATAVSELAVAETAAAVGGGEIAATSEAAAVAMAEEAGAAVALEAGLGGVAVGEAAVATGASAMATAIAATGIGLLVIGLAIAVYKIVDAMKDWNAATASTQKANEALAGSLKDLIEATKAYDDLNRISTARQLEGLDKIIAQRKALGVSAAETLALDKQSSDAKLKAYSDEVKANEITIEGIKKKEITALVAAGNVRAAEEVKNKYITDVANSQDKNFEAVVKSQDDAIKGQKEKYDAAQASYQRDVTLFKAAEDAKQQSDLLTNQEIKLNADDRRKFVLETARIQSEAQTALNNKTLNDDRSTLDERLAALKSNLAEQRKVLQAENAAVQSDPTASGTDKAISAKKSANDIKIAESESAQSIAKLKEDFRLKDLAATTDVQKKLFDVISQTNQDIYNNDAITEAQRLEALKTSIAARNAVLNVGLKSDLSSAGISDENIERIKQEGFFEIDNKKITNEELKKLIADYNAAQISLAKDANSERIKIVKDYYQAEQDLRDKALRDIERENDLQTEDRTDTYNNDLIALNETYKKGLLETEAYNREKFRIENTYSSDSLKIEIDKIEKSLAATVSAAEVEKKLKKELADLNAFVGPQTDDEKKIHDDRIKRVTEELDKIRDAVGKETELYKALSKLKKELSDSDKAASDESHAATIKVLEEIQQKSEQVFSVISGALNISATKEKNALAQQGIDAEKKAARDIEIANASAATEEQKAARILIINARLQAQKDQIAQQQKRIDQDAAKQQKAYTIFQIILATALNVAKALTIPGKIIAAALGAAQLAIAIATPIPKFKGGKFNSYEGPGIVDDGGVNEPIYRAATGQIEMSTGKPKDRITHIGKSDIVYPNFAAMMRSLAMPSIQPFRDNNQSQPFDRIETVLNKQTPLLQKIANKPGLQQSANEGGMVNIWKWGARQVEYLNDTTNW